MMKSWLLICFWAENLLRQEPHTASLLSVSQTPLVVAIYVNLMMFLVACSLREVSLCPAQTCVRCPDLAVTWITAHPSLQLTPKCSAASLPRRNSAATVTMVSARAHTLEQHIPLNETGLVVLPFSVLAVATFKGNIHPHQQAYYTL